MLSRRAFLQRFGLVLVSGALALCDRWKPTPTRTSTPTRTRVISCYTAIPEATPMPSQTPRAEELRLQAELLAEMGEQGGLETATLARVRASVQRDVALLAVSDGR
jgi:hypothetical protein